MQVSVSTPSRNLRTESVSAPPSPTREWTNALAPLGTRAVGALLDGLADYHSYAVEGLEHVPGQGGCLLVFNHSLATYDIGLLGRALQRRSGRDLRMLGDRLIFKLPGLRELATSAGLLEASPEPALKLLRQGALVGVAPGGMMEALRPSGDAYRIHWERRRGFARLAMNAQVPIVLAACPNADDLYDVHANPLTRWAYERARLPLPIATGRFGITLLPKKVKLRHVLSRPIQPPALPRPDAKPGDPDYEEILSGFHQQLIEEMQKLMAKARDPIVPASGPAHARLQRWAQELRTLRPERFG